MARSRSARRCLLLLGAASLVACADKPSTEEAERLIAAYPAFAAPKTVRLPSRIHVRGYQMSGWDNTQIRPGDNRVSWVMQSLESEQRIAVVHTVSNPTGISAADHLYDITPTLESMKTGDFAEDEGEAQADYNVNNTPGWVVSLGRRKVVVVSRILDKSVTTETVLPGNAIAEFEFAWVPTTTGTVFDQGGDEIDHLTGIAERGARGLQMDSRIRWAARAYLNRTAKGKWIVTGLRCGKCKDF
jgi:hypothetical protein